MPVPVAHGRVLRGGQPEARCRALVGVRRGLLREHRRVEQVAVHVAVGQVALDVGDRAQRVVLAGDVLQPVVFDPVVVQPVDGGEVPVQVGEVTVTARLAEDVHAGQRLEPAGVQRRPGAVVTDEDHAVRAALLDQLDEAAHLRGCAVGLQVVDPPR